MIQWTSNSKLPSLLVGKLRFSVLRWRAHGRADVSYGSRNRTQSEWLCQSRVLSHQPCLQSLWAQRCLTVSLWVRCVQRGWQQPLMLEGCFSNHSFFLSSPRNCRYHFEVLKPLGWAARTKAFLPTSLEAKELATAAPTHVYARTHTRVCIHLPASMHICTLIRAPAEEHLWISNLQQVRNTDLPHLLPTSLYNQLQKCSPTTHTSWQDTLQIESVQPLQVLGFHCPSALPFAHWLVHSLWPPPGLKPLLEESSLPVQWSFCLEVWWKISQ